MTKRANLHDALAKHAYDHALFATFNFQSDFFEEYCLEQFDSLAGARSVTVLMDATEHDGILGGPISAWPRKANVRYLLHPVRPKARFHPKLYLLASKRRGLLAVGSANLTRPGMTRNAELAGIYRYEDGKGVHGALFRQAFQFFSAVARRWPIAELTSRLGELAEDVPWIASSPTKPEPLPCRLIHNLERPLFAQIVEGLPNKVDRVVVLSPYYDEEPLVLEQLGSRLAPRAVTIYTQNGETTLTESSMRHPLLRRAGSEVLFGLWRDGTHDQALHAKGLAIVNGNRIRLAFGSANFTRAGLLSTPADGNVETAVVFDDVPLRQCDPDRLFDPDGTAKPAPLKSAPHRPPPSAPSHVIVLESAALDDSGRLTCVVVTELDDAEALLLFADGASARVRLSEERGAWVGALNDDQAKRCASSTVVLVEGRTAAGVAASNKVLLLNLQDLDASPASRRERRVREAQRSAEQFALYLDELAAGSDTAALVAFLTYCDIPVLNAPRAFAAGRERDKLERVSTELRAFGTQNLRAYASIHEAAMAFCDRHIARLHRHAGSATIDAVPSCMHVARSVSRVLARQVEQLLVGLEAGPTVDADEWYRHRQRLDGYLSTYLELLRTIHSTWLPSLFGAYAEHRVREVLQPDLEPLMEFVERFLDVRRRVEECRKERVRVRVQGKLVVPPVHDDNVVSPRSWARWAGIVGEESRALQALAG